MGVGGQHHAAAALPLGKGLGTHCTAAGWAPGPVWTGVEERLFSTPTGFRTRDRPACSELL
jgi:hypothetical protein